MQHPLLCGPGQQQQRPRSYPPHMTAALSLPGGRRVVPPLLSGRTRTMSTPPNSSSCENNVVVVAVPPPSPPIQRNASHSDAAAPPRPTRVRLYRVAIARINANGHLELRPDVAHEFAFERRTHCITIKPPNELPHERSSDYVQLECNSHVVQGLLDVVESIEVVESTLIIDWIPPFTTRLSLHSSVVCVTVSSRRLHVCMALRSRLRFGPTANCGDLHLTLLNGGNEVHHARYVYTLCIDGEGVSECLPPDVEKVPESAEQRSMRLHLPTTTGELEKRFWAAYDYPFIPDQHQEGNACVMCLVNLATLVTNACGHATLCGSCAGTEQCRTLFIETGCFLCRCHQPIAVSTHFDARDPVGATDLHKPRYTAKERPMAL